MARRGGRVLRGHCDEERTFPTRPGAGGGAGGGAGRGVGACLVWDEEDRRGKRWGVEAGSG